MNLTSLLCDILFSLTTCTILKILSWILTVWERSQLFKVEDFNDAAMYSTAYGPTDPYCPICIQVLLKLESQ